LQFTLAEAYVFFVLLMSTIFWLRLIQLWDPFHAYEDNSASLSNGLCTLITLDLWGTRALFLLSSTYASHGYHQTIWDIHAQAIAGRLWWSDGWAGRLSWFHTDHDLGFLLSVWGLLLSMFLKLQVQGQMKRQLNLRQIDWTNPHLINSLYLVLCVFLRGTWLGMLSIGERSLGSMQPGLHAMPRYLVLQTTATSVCETFLQCFGQPIKP